MPGQFTFNSWRDRLLDASFRGVPFKIARHEFTLGRRTKVYELWGRNTAAVYDQGGKAEYFDVEGYVLQNDLNDFDYWKEKFNLIDALRKRGYGILMHPFLGKLYVSVFEDQTVSEDLESGGIAIFKMRFVQNRAPVLSKYALAQSQNVDFAANKAKAAASDSVGDKIGGPKVLTSTASGGRLIGSGQVSLYQDSLLTGLNDVLVQISSGLSAIKGVASSVINEALNAVSSIISTLDQFIDTPCALAAQMDAASDGFLNVCGIGEDLITDVITGSCSGLEKEDPTVLDGTSIPQELGDSVVNGILTALDFDSSIFGNVTTVQAENVRALTYATQIQLLMKALQVAIRTEFLQRSRYESMLAKLRTEFDALLYAIGEFPDNTEIFSATEDARNTFFTNALNRLDLLARQIAYTVPPTIQTALHVAYNRYSDLNRDSEIMALNRIDVDHPGFLPQGEVIQILDE